MANSHARDIAGRTLGRRKGEPQARQEESRIFFDSLVKENSKYNKFLTQNIQEIWDTIKRLNIRIIGVEEGEELQLKGPENIFNKIVEENFPNLKKDIPMKAHEAYRTPNRLDQKKSPHPIIIKTQRIKKE